MPPVCGLLAGCGATPSPAWHSPVPALGQRAGAVLHKASHTYKFYNCFAPCRLNGCKGENTAVVRYKTELEAFIFSLNFRKIMWIITWTKNKFVRKTSGKS